MKHSVLIRGKYSSKILVPGGGVKKMENLGENGEENWNMKDFSLFFHKKLNILTFS